MHNSGGMPKDNTEKTSLTHSDLKEIFKKETSLNIENYKKNSEKQQDVISPDLQTLSEIWTDLRERLIKQKPTPEYPIGLREIDEILWGMKKSELTVIGGRTSVGKSDMALYISRQLADIGQRVVYFSLEMSKEQILQRLFSSICRVDNRLLRGDTAKKEVDTHRVVFEDWIENIKLLIDDEYGYVYKDMVEVCEIIKPDFVIIDYIQMISTKGFRNKLDAIEEYVRMLKQLAVKMNMGVVLVSQLNRTAVGNPTMSAMKHAGVIEEHPGIVLTLNWDWEKDPPEYRVNIEKNRYGEVRHNIKLNYLPQYSDFKEVNDVPFKEKYGK